MSENISNRILDVDEPAAIIPFIGMILTLTVVSYGILYLYAMIKFS